MGRRGWLYPTPLESIWNYFKGIRQLARNRSGTPAELATALYHPSLEPHIINTVNPASSLWHTGQLHTYVLQPDNLTFYIDLHFFRHDIQVLDCCSICSSFSAQNPLTVIIYCEKSVLMRDFTWLMLAQPITLHTSSGSRNTGHEKAQQ